MAAQILFSLRRLYFQKCLKPLWKGYYCLLKHITEIMCCRTEHFNILINNSKHVLINQKFPFDFCESPFHAIFTNHGIHYEWRRCVKKVNLRIIEIIVCDVDIKAIISSQLFVIYKQLTAEWLFNHTFRIKDVDSNELEYFCCLMNCH